MLTTEIPLLDHGYIKLIRVEGRDRDIAQSARMSTDTEGDDAKDTGLTRRLIRDEHTSPVEFVGFVFEVKCPIFVARQWMRHRTSKINEFSGRYSEFPDEFYVPAPERVQAQSTFNKQGSAEQLPDWVNDEIRETILCHSQDSYVLYQGLLSQGLTRELARMVLGTNFYTKFRWRLDLHNLFHFLRLREDPHAQYEIRVYANAVHRYCTEYFPIATKAFEDYSQNVVKMSPELAQLLLHVANDTGVALAAGSLKSEMDQLMNRFVCKEAA